MLKVDLSESRAFYEVVSERDEKTGEIVVISEDYVFRSDDGEEIARFDASSEIGKVINVSKFYY